MARDRDNLNRWMREYRRTHRAIVNARHAVSPENRRGWAAFTLANLAKELAKCDVRCPICHRIRHWRDKLSKLGGQTDKKKVGNG